MAVKVARREIRKGGIGRPISFDRDLALDRAMLLFWQHGYEGTSIADLTNAMGLAPTSLYAAFGNKRQLFIEAVYRYLNSSLTLTGEVAQPATARELVLNLLQSAAARYTGEATPRGCLLATSAISCSKESQDVKEQLSAIRHGFRKELVQRFSQAVKEGEISADEDIEALVAHITAVLQGMSTLARDGASRDQLFRLIDIAMRSWPTK